MTLASDGRPYPWSQGCADAITPALRTVVDTEPRPDLVVWLASWDAVDRSLDGVTVKLGTPAGDAVLRREVDRAAALLTADGARLIILTVPRPVPGSETVLPGLDEDSRVPRPQRPLPTRRADRRRPRSRSSTSAPSSARTDAARTASTA